MTITELELRSLGMTTDGRENTKKVIKHKKKKKAGNAKYCQAATCPTKDIPLSAYSTNDYCEACMTHGRHLDQEIKAQRAKREAPPEEDKGAGPVYPAEEYKPLKNLYLLRTEKQMSLRQIAAATGIPRQSLWQYSSTKNGKGGQPRGCPPDRAKAIAKCLKVSVAVLVGDEEYLIGEEQKCTKCGNVLDLKHFYRDPKSASKRKRSCKVCCEKYAEERRKRMEAAS